MNTYDAIVIRTIISKTEAGKYYDLEDLAKEITKIVPVSLSCVRYNIQWCIKQGVFIKKIRDYRCDILKKYLRVSYRS